MNFLTISHYKDSWFAIPPEKRAEVAMASLAFVDKYLKLGKCKEGYGLANQKGTVSIWDFASDEDAARIVREYPMYPFTDTEIIPLVGYQALTKVIKESIEAAKKAAKK